MLSCRTPPATELQVDGGGGGGDRKNGKAMERLLRVLRIIDCELDSTEHTGGINHPGRVVFDMSLTCI